MNGGPRNAKGFTIREQLLIADYLRTRGANATESAKRAGYSGNRNTLGVTAHETLRRPKIAREINRRMAAKLSTAEIESEIVEVAQSSVLVTETGKMKALDLLTKINGMVVQKVETSDTTERDAASSAFASAIQSAALADNIPESQAACELYERLSKSGVIVPTAEMFGPYWADVLAGQQQPIEGGEQ